MAAAPGRRGALQGSEVECTKLLESLFRYDAFRSQQWGIIEALDRDEDCLVLMATGGGKSLLYQFLSIARSAVESGGDAAAFEARRGTTLVVAPLISLGPIRQCGLLKELGVRTVVLDGLAFDSPAGLDVATGAFDVLFASPDALPQWLPRLQALNASGLLDLIAIDEAHCASPPSYGYRGEYATLGKLRGKLQNVPILAVTSTATREVMADLPTRLALVNTRVFTSSLVRLNVGLEVRDMGPSVSEDLKGVLGALFKGPNASIANGGSGCAIVYVPTQKEAESLAVACNLLPCAQGARSGDSPFAAPYHAGLPKHVKAATHLAFTKGKVRVVCATYAFAMGVDVPDVRCVVHYGLPKSLES